MLRGRVKWSRYANGYDIYLGGQLVGFDPNHSNAMTKAAQFVRKYGRVLA